MLFRNTEVQKVFTCPQGLNPRIHFTSLCIIKLFQEIRLLLNIRRCQWPAYRFLSNCSFCYKIIPVISRTWSQQLKAAKGCSESWQIRKNKQFLNFLKITTKGIIDQILSWLLGLEMHEVLKIYDERWNYNIRVGKMEG